MTTVIKIHNFWLTYVFDQGVFMDLYVCVGLCACMQARVHVYVCISTMCVHVAMCLYSILMC